MNIDELTSAVQALSQKGVLDYLQMILPILLSAVAIWISIRTASKQNKIALFEKRMCVLNEIERIISFAESIEDTKEQDNKIVVKVFNSAFGMHLEAARDYSLEDCFARIKQTECSFSMIEYLYEGDYSDKAFEVAAALSDYMVKVLLNKKCDDERKAFVKATKDFEAAEYKALCKETKL